MPTTLWQPPMVHHRYCCSRYMPGSGQFRLYQAAVGSHALYEFQLLRHVQHVRYSTKFMFVIASGGGASAMHRSSFSSPRPRGGSGSHRSRGGSGSALSTQSASAGAGAGAGAGDNAGDAEGRILHAPGTGADERSTQRLYVVSTLVASRLTKADTADPERHPAEAVLQEFEFPAGKSTTGRQWVVLAGGRLT